MEGTQLDLFDPGTHEHVWTLTQGPYETQSAITLPSGSKWCWTCHSWVTQYRDGSWLNWREKEERGFTWRDEMKRG